MTGLGALYAPLDLEAGSDGFNTGFAFPDVLMAMVRAARKVGCLVARMNGSQRLEIRGDEQELARHELGVDRHPRPHGTKFTRG